MTKVTINISQKSRQSVKIFVIVQVILCAIFCPLLIIQGFGMLKEIIYLGLLGIGGGLFFIYIVIKQIPLAFEREYIILDKRTIAICRQHLFSTTSEHFLLSNIISIEHVGHREYTEHPMNNSVVDFTGLAAGEKLVQAMVDDGTMEITSKDKIVRFGKNIASWDAETIIDEIENKTKHRLRKKQS
jgi:hypothetical protein